MEKPAARVTLPYIQGVSEAIRRVLKDLDITTSFRPMTSLRKVLSHPKDPLPPSTRSGVIYQIPCRDCDKSYIGQTGRTLLQRIKEHQRAVKTMNTDNSALAEHAWNEHHHIAWEVVDQVKNPIHINLRIASRLLLNIHYQLIGRLVYYV